MLFEPLQTVAAPNVHADITNTLQFIDKRPVRMLSITNASLTCDENPAQEIDDFTQT